MESRLMIFFFSTHLLTEDLKGRLIPDTDGGIALQGTCTLFVLKKAEAPDLTPHF